MVVGYKKELVSKLIFAFLEKYGSFEVAKVIYFKGIEYTDKIRELNFEKSKTTCEVKKAEIKEQVKKLESEVLKSVSFRFRNTTDVCYEFLQNMKFLAKTENCEMEAKFMNPARKTEKGYFEVKFSNLEIYENDVPF